MAAIGNFGLVILIWSNLIKPLSTMIKPLWNDLTCNVEPLSLKNYNDLTMKLKVKYLIFVNLTSSYTYELLVWRSRNKKKITRWKRIHKPGGNFLDFQGFFIKILENPENFFLVCGFFWILCLCRSKVQLAPPNRNFINGIANPKMVYLYPIYTLQQSIPIALRL